MNSLATSLHVPYHILGRWEDKKHFSSKKSKALWREAAKVYLMVHKTLYHLPLGLPIYLLSYFITSPMYPKTLATPKNLRFTKPIIVGVV